MTSENNFVFSLSHYLVTHPTLYSAPPLRRERSVEGSSKRSIPSLFSAAPWMWIPELLSHQLYEWPCNSYSRRITTKLLTTHSENKCYTLYALGSVLWQKQNPHQHTRAWLSRCKFYTLLNWWNRSIKWKQTDPGYCTHSPCSVMC